MVFVDETFSVAECIVGYDLAAKKEWATSGFKRLFTGFALVGANAALECVLAIKVNKVVIATLKNGDTGLAVDVSTSWYPIGSMFVIPPGVPIAVEVVSAPTVNPIRLQLNLAEVA